MVKPADKGKARVKQDADYIFHELTRSICPECKRRVQRHNTPGRLHRNHQDIGQNRRKTGGVPTPVMADLSGIPN